MANPNIVSVTSIKGESVGFNLSATTTTTLMTVASNKVVKINRITVANVDGTNAADVTVQLQRPTLLQMVFQILIHPELFLLQKQYQCQLTQRWFY